jgi:hypothetical protein
MVLVVLVGLPVAGTLCAALCSAARMTAAHDRASAHHHHQSDAAHDASLGSTPIMIGNVSAHECGSHTGTGQDSAIAAFRADGNVVSAPLSLAGAHTSIVAVTIFTPVVADSPPPATTPPTSTPVVLRV